MATNLPFGPETPITVKVIIEKTTRKFKIPFSELGPEVLPAKLRSLLEIPEGIPIKFQRWSDSGSSYEELDPSDNSVFKKLARAARAKLKLRIRATVPPMPNGSPPYSVPSEHPALASEVTLTNANGTVNAAAPSPLIFSPVRVPSASEITLNSNCSRLSLTTKAVGNDVTATEFFPAYPPKPLPTLRNLEIRPKAESATAATPTVALAGPSCNWSVYCNVCDHPMANEHYHCTICDNGDYDLCQACVDDGHHCPDEGHWLIKRTVKDGRVVNSTTETVPSKPKSTVTEVPSEMPGAYTEDKKVETEDDEQQEELPSRTCNACVGVFSEDYFVTCQDCEDFDLCLACHESSAHGHHPGHTFKPASAETVLTSTAKALCAPGRNVSHAAICDGCDKPIFGVRHKCLSCPDWDYCSECVKNARYIHPNHRFAALYDPIPGPHSAGHRHVGIYCDGPLCKDKREYVMGTRYKCAICHDTDFCGNCEASPRNRHNRTHPLIKFKTPVRNVSVTTMGEDNHGKPMVAMGDNAPFIRPNTANAPSPVRTVADVKPSEPAPIPAYVPSVPKTKEKIQIKDLLAEPIEEKIKVEDLKPTPVQIASQELNAHYVRDTVKDGSIMAPNQKFVQVWTLRNPGPHAWPAGCVVSFVGGDRMFDIDDAHPSSEADLAEAQRSNVVGRVVEVGEEIAFRVMMKAPKHEGTAISYWRLKAADGVVFGHRLWCHIKVVAVPQMPNYTTSPPPGLTPVTVPTVDRTESVGRPKMEEDFLRLLLRNQEHQARLQQQKLAEAAKLQAEAEQKQKREIEEREQRARILRTLSQDFEALHKKNELKRMEPLLNAAVKAQEAAEKEQKEDGAAAELAATTPSVKVEPAPATVETEDGKTERSAMIFPKLEKESPSSSTHESVKTAAEPKTPEAKTVAPVTVASPSAKTETETDIFEDAESVDLLESSDEDGFLTDEEYEILDASDEEHEA